MLSVKAGFGNNQTNSHLLLTLEDLGEGFLVFNPDERDWFNSIEREGVAKTTRQGYFTVTKRCLEEWATQYEHNGNSFQNVIALKIS